MINFIRIAGIAMLLAACDAVVDAPSPRDEPPVAPLAAVEAPVDTAACIPEGHTRESLAELKAGGFVIADDAERQIFALAILECLGSPDPSLRDGVAYEALATMMRERVLTTDTLQAIRIDLEAKLEADDPDGFVRPFAALVLSEVVRADRIQPFLSQSELDRIAQRANRYMLGVADYRGFDAEEGWRHGVAHGADLLMQLALNPRVLRRGLDLVRAGVAAQIAPPGHAYVYGEAERLARPILMIARRGVFTQDEWSNWFTEVAGPGQLGSWEGVYQSEAGLARRHNLMAFLSALHVNASLGEDNTDDAILPGVEAALRSLP